MEGLIVIMVNQGAMVSPITIEDILELYVVRENLEGLASRLATKHSSQQDLRKLENILAKMRQAVTEERLSDLAKLNIEFHKVIRQAAHNQFLDHFLTQVEHAVRRFGRTTFEIPGRAEDTIEEHRQIVEAITTSDAKAAESLAIEHMRQARELRIRMLTDY